MASLGSLHHAASRILHTMRWGFIFQRDCEFLEDRVEINASEHAALTEHLTGTA